MTRRWLAGLAFALAGLDPGPALAVISCYVSSSGFSALYDTTAGTSNDNVAAASIHCTRASTDADSVTYALNANNGANPQGLTNQARLGATASYLGYELYRNATYAALWDHRKANAFTGTINFAGSLSVSLPITYYARFPAGQNVAAGVYSDTVTMSLDYGGVSAPAATFPVTVAVNTQCLISTPPGTVAFTYTSFQATPSSASTPYAVRCTSGVAYTMSLDAYNGALLGLSYSLSLSATAATGTGLAQPYSVNGTIAAGQAGACSTGMCSGSQTRTLTITY